MQFILLLFLRHSLPVFLGGINDFSLTLLMVSSISNCSNINTSSYFPKVEKDFVVFLQLPLLKTLGILLVAYFFVKSFIVIQRCRQERVRNNVLRLSNYDSCRYIELKHGFFGFISSFVAN